MKHGSLFSGIGGFDIAAEWMGWENIFHCEWNKFGQKVLKYYWPKAISYENIIETDFTIHRGQIDILTGGFPCQPYSQAGKRLGKEDDRHLWPEMLRAIQEIKPIYIVGENVSGIVSWNEGLVFNEVQTDLENEGYEIQPVILPAVSVNAPHRRHRVWFVAYSNECTKKQSKSRPDNRRGATSTNEEIRIEQKAIQHTGHNETQGVTTDPNSIRGRNKNDRQRQRTKVLPTNCKTNVWQNFPTQSPICIRNDGFSSKLDGITFPKWRNESIKAGGNAIVPQVALQIFKAIQEHLCKPFEWGGCGGVVPFETLEDCQNCNC